MKPMIDVQQLSKMFGSKKSRRFDQLTGRERRAFLLFRAKWLRQNHNDENDDRPTPTIIG